MTTKARKPRDATFHSAGIRGNTSDCFIMPIPDYPLVANIFYAIELDAKSCRRLAKWLIAASEYLESKVE